MINIPKLQEYVQYHITDTTTKDKIAFWIADHLEGDERFKYLCCYRYSCENYINIFFKTKNDNGWYAYRFQVMTTMPVPDLNDLDDLAMDMLIKY